MITLPRFLSTLTYGFLFSCIHTAQASEEAELLALISLLDEETNIATQNKMNADYVPGMVTVLHAEELMAHGYETVADALNNVAGFFVEVNNQGDETPIVRGVGATLSANNLKVLLDGQALNRPIDASADWAFRMPLNALDRIEVIRGPGSAVHGEYAFSGVINLISKRASSVYLKHASHQHNELGISQAIKFNDKTSLNFNLSHWDRSASGREGSLDNFASRGFGYSPSEIHDQETGLVFLTQAQLSKTQIDAAYARVERGGWFGRQASIPEGLEPRIEETYSLALTREWQMGDNSLLGASISAHQSELQHAAYLPLPAGVPGPARPPGAPPRPPEAERFIRHANQDQSYAIKMFGQWQLNQAHNLYSELSYKHSEVTASQRHDQINDVAELRPADANLVQDGVDRTLISFSLQDQWQLNAKTEITAGLRFDHYDDWGSNTSPRLGAVWRGNDRHILKFQYSQAFRPPTLADENPGEAQFPNFQFTALDEEKISSTEAAYIYRRANASLRTTIFQNHIEDLIEFYLVPGQAPRWRNRGDITTSGLELEWRQKIRSNFEWNANIAYVDAEDHFDEIDQELTGSVPWMGNLGFSWEPKHHIRHALQWRYMGEQEDWEVRRRAETQEKFKAWNTLDYTLTYSQAFGIKALKLQASINNIGDQQYRIVANPPQYLYGLGLGERRFWLQLSYEL